MRINYKRELEEAARSIILIHNPHTLINMIARMIVRKVKVTHAGILLHDKDRDTYILNVSRGQSGLKIPAGYVRLDRHSPLIRLFSDKKNNIFALNDGILVSAELDQLLWKATVIAKDNILRDILLRAHEQMEMFKAQVCIPSYFQHILIGLLLLGDKISGEKFHKEELNFFAALASDVAMAVRNAQLFQDLQLESKRAHDLFINTTIALAAAVEAKDRYMSGHTERVANLSLAIGHKLVEMEKFPSKDLETLHIAALLHDIGKIGIPESILNKTDKLDENEMLVIKEHPAKGVEILKPIKELKGSLLGVKYHHENYDGKGYPEGLRGEDIPIIASIIAVVDAFDAMTTDRPYRKARSLDEAVEELKRCSGTQFNPLVVQAAAKLYREGRLREIIKKESD